MDNRGQWTGKRDCVCPTQGADTSSSTTPTAEEIRPATTNQENHFGIITYEIPVIIPSSVLSFQNPKAVPTSYKIKKECQ